MITSAQAECITILVANMMAAARNAERNADKSMTPAFREVFKNHETEFYDYLRSLTDVSS